VSALTVVPVGGPATAAADRDALVGCLADSPPRLPPWLGYDELGSELFEQITELPDYYLTRVERRLLSRHAEQIATQLDCGCIAELGSGSAKKTRLLLAANMRRRETTYLPLDVSRDMLEASAATLRSDLPGLTVTGLWGRYEAGLAWLRTHLSGPVVVTFLGSNLGNSTPAERDALLADIARTLRPGDGFLVSVDLVKPRHVLESCYNDPADRSVFADFRLNYLTALNRRFDADFDREDFTPRAHYDAAAAVVAGNLYTLREHTASVPGLGLTLHLRRGDPINVGYSAKFRADRFRENVATHGFELQNHWIDPRWRYGILLFRRC
jgi:L-histidine N-alpha-methyltransferase